jgi:crossover junction endodeoxyribonuclease RusA
MEVGRVMDKITAPFPPSINTVYTVHRNRKIMSAKGRDYKYEVSQLLGKDREPYKGPISCTYRFYRGDRRKYDVSNYVKVIEDCITDANYWVDDSQVVEMHIFKCEIDRENPRVEIEVVEL